MPGTPRHVVNGNTVYELPFGLGKPLLNQRGMVSTIAGNWQLTSTALARTGFPVNVLLPSSYTTPEAPPARSVPIWYQASRSPRRGAKRSRNGSILRLSLSRLAHLAMRRVICFAGRAHGRSIWAPPKDFPSPSACSRISRRVLQHLQSPAVRPAEGHIQPVERPGFGSIINTINLNTAIVNPISPVGSGTPREIQLALRLDF